MCGLCDAHAHTIRLTTFLCAYILRGTFSICRLRRRRLCRDRCYRHRNLWGKFTPAAHDGGVMGFSDDQPPLEFGHQPLREYKYTMHRDTHYKTSRNWRAHFFFFFVDRSSNLPCVTFGALSCLMAHTRGARGMRQRDRFD